MSQKVWVIPDYIEESPPAASRFPDGPERSGARPPTGPVRTAAPGPEKNPALAFSLAMLVWGGGHIYLREYGLGAVFAVSMMLFYAVAAAAVFFHEGVGLLLAGIGLPAPLLAHGAVLFLAVGILFFMVNAVDAYHRAEKLRSEPFSGADQRFWPLFCSLLFPGWGQFLNAQPRKGLFFFLFGGMGIFSFLVAALAHFAWPVIRSGPVSLLFDIYLAAALLLIPASVLIWIVAAHDASRSCRERIRRQKCATRPGYRMPSRWSARTLIPRGTAVLALLLAISLGMQYIPPGFYRSHLDILRSELEQGGMRLLPELLGRGMRHLDH